MSVTRESVERVKRLRRLREFEESARRQDYAVALNRETDCEAEVMRRREAIATCQDELRKVLTGGSLKPRAFFDLYAALDDAAAAVEHAEEVLNGARRERVARESVWREARKRCLALEKLEERRASQWKESLDLAEKQQRDEIALSRYVRAKAMATESRGEES